MSIREVTYYEVVCDFEGCGTKTGDMGGDFSAFSDLAALAERVGLSYATVRSMRSRWALDDWINGAGYFHDGVTLCAEHAPMDCDECEAPPGEEHADGCSRPRRQTVSEWRKTLAAAGGERA